MGDGSSGSSSNIAAEYLQLIADYQELGRISPGKQNSNETLPIPKGCFNFGYF
jgi:hypothetical protein